MSLISKDSTAKGLGVGRVGQEGMRMGEPVILPCNKIKQHWGGQFRDVRPLVPTRSAM